MTDEEIVAACAEKVMGWEVRPVAMFGQSEDYWCTHADHPQPTGFQSSTVVHRLVSEYDPLVLDADSCAVLDRMVELGYGLALVSPRSGPHGSCEEWICAFGKMTEPDPTPLRDKDRRRAIVLAALKAVGVNA